MNTFARWALIIVAAVPFAGCGGSQPPIGALEALSQTQAIATPAQRGGSWMLPQAKAEDLLYVSAGDSVYVFSYPDSRRRVGTLTGFSAPAGLCSDRDGNVYVTSSGTAQIFEFAHGGKEPIKTLSDPHGNPYGCSIDPVSRRFAVVNYCTTVKSGGCGGPGSVAVYRNDEGPPTIIKDNGYYLLYCGYDNAGNLFVDGYSRTSSASIEFAELHKGGSIIKRVRWPNKMERSYGAIAWDGTYLALGNGFGMIYRLQVLNSRANIVGTTQLERWGHGLHQFWIQGGTLIGPNEGMPRIRFWKYPIGGYPFYSNDHLPRGEFPFGSTVSLRR